MKILKIWSTFQTELKYHDHYLADEMNLMNIETIFLTSNKLGKDYKNFVSCDNLNTKYYNESKIYRLKSIELFGVPFIIDIFKMYKLLFKSNIDIIHIFGIGNPVSMLVLFMVCLFNKDIPIFCNDHSHNMIAKTSIAAKIYYKFMSLLYKTFSKKIKKIFVPNKASYNYLIELYGSKIENKLKIIPLGYDSNTFFLNKNKKNKDDLFIIGFAGKIVESKRLEVLLNTINKLCSINICCLVVGVSEEGITSYQKKLITKYNSEKIKFFPIIKNSCELADFYNYIDLAVFPGSISITTIEVNGCGTPVLLYNSIEGLEDRVEGGRGFLFNSQKELEDFIKYYYSIKIDNFKIEKNTIKYSWKFIAKQYLKEYQEVVDTLLSL